MALLNCPECHQQVSSDALACPNCGRPIAPPVPIVEQPKIIVTEPEVNEIPKWAIASIVVVGALLILVAIALLRNREDDTARNINVAVPARSANTRETARIDTETERNQITVPPSSTTITTPPPPPSSTTGVPQTVVPSSPISTEKSKSDRGTVVIEAKITNRSGAIQNVRNEKFYLLDDDLESILNDADLEPIEGQSLTNSLGMAIMFPSRYGDFQRDALNAIKKHIKYSVTTDGGGKAAIKDVKPDSYYLFGITKSGSGFAVWSSPVSITDGENRLNLSPARLTEISG